MLRRRDERGVVVENALQAADMADGPDRGAANLADALCRGIRGGQDLRRLIVEEQMIVTEMRP
jgi:hypothetical protein